MRPQASGLNLGVAPGNTPRDLAQWEWMSDESDGLGTARKRSILLLTRLQAWHNLGNVGPQGCHWLGFTFVMQFQERFTPRRLHTRPYASMKFLPCVRVPLVVSRGQVGMGWNISRNIGGVAKPPNVLPSVWAKCMWAVRRKDMDRKDMDRNDHEPRACQQRTHYNRLAKSGSRW